MSIFESMTFPMSRRKALGAVANTAAVALSAVSLPTRAQFRVEISGVGGSQIPIALPDFRDESRSGQAIGAIIRADLERSGQFRNIESPSGLFEGSTPTWSEWRARNADALAAGSATRLADGRIDVRYKLWDVVKGQDLGGEAYAVIAEDVRLSAHRIADAIYKKLTGERGVFATRMAYVTKTGGRYALRIADADGEGGQVALASPDPIISPAWSPNGRELAYVSFESRKAVVWIQDLSTGRRRVLADFRGSNSSPAFSPDGQQLALTLSRDGGSQLFLMNRDGGGLRRLTQSSAIDTEAVFSPDGRSLFFVSDRGGGPQIYRMALAGGAAERVTFNGAYNISPDISPDGRTMAFITRLGGGIFRLCVMDLASGAVQQISDTTDDESPSFSPNGRLLVYATRVGGRDVLMTTTLDGKIKAKLIASLADVREPVWGPFTR
ncbi:Tol-Pal system beta propeller repeat protein TolB [Roseateles koreensis]|uniref:Tol-Pal system protein TolB n=2 Tax=Roseateles koreensis TaxID=2987526 RepID=A0ABT5KN54_9BURK|nr:Tol-Pal system beta propeller repeat protein TolB [Roseateles koreensis]MDC8784339.1 Tol-Pal system beta propeller repeat protein TolB [Roseateles koreensis]